MIQTPTSGNPEYDLVIAVGAGVVLALATVAVFYLRSKSKDEGPK